MNSIPYITQIIKVEPFKVTCLWNTGEVRVNDFKLTFEKEGLFQPIYQLVDYQLFKYVSVSEEGTLHWVNVSIKLNFDGKEITSPLDLDPVVLYDDSQPISKFRLILNEELA